jgi:hypothetical protein
MVTSTKWNQEYSIGDLSWQNWHSLW